MRSLFQAVAENRLQLDCESHEFRSDDEVVVLTAKERRDQVSRQKPARFETRGTFAFFGLAAALLLSVIGFIASSQTELWPGFRNKSHVTVNIAATSMFSEAEELTKEKKPIAPFEVRLLKAVSDETSATTFFTEILMHDGTVSYRHKNGLLVTAKKGNYVKSSPPVPGAAQFFGKRTNEDGTISLMVHGGSWLTALPSGEIVADGVKITAWQKFTPKQGDNGAMALRTVHGKYIGVNQTLSREFAVGNKLMKDSRFGFQATPARALMKDSGIGFQATPTRAVSIIIMAQASSIGSREKFTMIKNMADDTVSFKTKYGTFLTSPMDGLVSGDSTIPCGREAFTLILKHSMVSLRTFDGWYITAHRRGFLVGDAEQPGLHESFNMQSNDDGTVSFKSYHGKYFRATNVPVEPNVPLEPEGGDWALAV